MGKKVTTATAGGGLFRLMFVKRRRDKPERGTVRGPQLDSRPREDNADETVLIILSPGCLVIDSSISYSSKKRRQPDRQAMRGRTPSSVEQGTIL